MKQFKIFLIAGEESGDVLGAKLMQSLLTVQKLLQQQEQIDLELKFMGVGGERMIAQGLQPLFPMERLAVMGVLEVLPKLPMLWYLIRHTAKRIFCEQPDLVVTIDSPDFCMRVIRRLDKLDTQHQLKRYHIVAPSVWIYRPKRAAAMAKIYDMLFTLLPFEAKYFEKYGLETVFIGHPLVADHVLQQRIRSLEDVEHERHQLVKFSQQYHLPSSLNSPQVKFSRREKIICVTPGSRTGEIKRLLPVFMETLQQVQQEFPLRVFILAVTSKKSLIEQLLAKLSPKLSLEILTDDAAKHTAILLANLALTKSGTNTFEMMLHQLPLVIAYKFNALTVFIARKIYKIVNQFANLVNIMAQREIIPEFVQENCTASKLSQQIITLLKSPLSAQQQVAEYNTVLKAFVRSSNHTPMEIVANQIIQLACQNPS